MVSSSQPLASAVGAQILQEGGNAADACIAMAATLNVVEPTSTGIGGDVFCLFYDAKTGEVHAVNGSGRAPSALTPASVASRVDPRTHRFLDPLDANTVTVPGACAAWFDVKRRHGSSSVSMASLLRPAIEMATRGAPISEITSRLWNNAAPTLAAKNGGNCDLLFPDGSAPKPGSVFTNLNLAKTFTALCGQEEEKAFYTGAIAEAIVAEVSKRGGVMTLADLSNHRSTFEAPINTEYNGYRVYECAPNGQGLVALLALNTFAQLHVGLQEDEAVQMHGMIECIRLAFADAKRYLADPSQAKVPVEELLSVEYARKRASSIQLNKAFDYDSADPVSHNGLCDCQKNLCNDHCKKDVAHHVLRHGHPEHSSDTVYFCCVDKEGNACSFINSNYMGFGSCIVVNGFGFSLQNRGYNFLVGSDAKCQQHPNTLAPGKRPYHTIIPCMVTFNGHLHAALGVMGGFMQPQGHMQVCVRLLLQKWHPQQALDWGRFCVDENGDLLIEESVDDKVIQYLRKVGHTRMRIVRSWERSVFGRGQIIIRNTQTGVLEGACDPRSDGTTIGL